jgi:hypothetical protein
VSLAGTPLPRATAPGGRLDRVLPWDAGDGGRSYRHAVGEPVTVSHARALAIIGAVGESGAVAIGQFILGERIARHGSAERDARSRGGARAGRGGPRP